MSKKSDFFASVALFCFAYAALALILLHVLRPDFAPASHMISEYAVASKLEFDVTYSGRDGAQNHRVGVLSRYP